MNEIGRRVSWGAAAAVWLASAAGCAHEKAPLDPVPAPPGSPANPTAQAAPAIAAPTVPDAIKVPAGQRVVLKGNAKGVQIYGCGAKDGGAYEWTLKGPLADLVDDQGQHLAKHYAGPTWEANDGSKVVGQLASKADAPDASAVAWLLLSAKSHEGQGALSKVASVQRVDTRGGKAPANGCDAAHSGAEARVDYTAAYYFYE